MELEVPDRMFCAEGLGRGAWDETVATSQFSKSGASMSSMWKWDKLPVNSASLGPLEIAHSPRLAFSDTSDFFAQI